MLKGFVLVVVLLISWSPLSSSTVHIDFEQVIFKDNSCEILKSTSHHNVPWLHYICKEKRIPDYVHFPTWHKKASDARLRFDKCDSMDSVDVAEMESLLLESGRGHLQGLDLEDCTGNIDEFLTKFPEVRNLTLERTVIKEPLLCMELDWYDYIGFKIVYAEMFTRTKVLRDVYFVTDQQAVIEEGTFAPLAHILAIVYIKGEALNFSLTLFQGLTKLDTLTVENNVIEVDELPVEVFSTLSSLRLFNFKIKRIGKIPNDVFANCPLLTIVNLSSNGIRVIEANAFAHLAKLRELNLEKNQITTIPDGVFNGLVRLTILNMNQNNISFSNINSSPFEGLTFLQILSLNGNPVEKLPVTWFRNNSFIREVNLVGSNLNQYDIDELLLYDQDNHFVNLKEMANIKDTTNNWREIITEYFLEAKFPDEDTEINFERVPITWLKPKRTEFNF